MNLNIVTPVSSFSEEGVTKVIAEGPRGFFCLLPRHIDYVEAVIPGILSYTFPDNREVFVAVDEGILVKKGADITVSVRAAIRGREPGTLKKVVKEEIEAIDEREKRSRRIIARLEADFARRFLEAK